MRLFSWFFSSLVGFLTFQWTWIGNPFFICAFLSQCSYEGFRGNICDHSVNRKAEILEGPAFMVYRFYLLTQLWFLKLQQIMVPQITFSLTHRNSKFAINIISEQFHFFFQFVNMYILRYDRYSMTWFIKMEKISCMSIIYFVDISSQNITFMKTEHMPTWMNKRRRYVTVWNQISTYLIFGILIGYFEYFFSCCGILCSGNLQFN